MKILVSMRTSVENSYKEERDAISYDWIEYFNKHKLLPILVPNGFQAIEQYFFDNDVAGVLLTGGGDIAGAHSGLKELTKREQTENQLLKTAIGCRVPVLGVCRGLQLINKYFGGSLKTIEDQTHVSTHHDIILTQPFLGYPKNTQIKVNSYHHYGLEAAGMGTDLIPFAKSVEGWVEGFKHKQHNVWAVQWHPERKGVSFEFDKKLLNEWLRICD